MNNKKVLILGIFIVIFIIGIIILKSTKNTNSSNILNNTQNSFSNNFSDNTQIVEDFDED